MFKKKDKLINDGHLIAMVIIGMFLSFILLLGFVFVLPIFLAVKYSAWWLLLLIATVPIGLAPFVIFVNKGDDKQ